MSDRLDLLRAVVRPFGSALVGFSGGVDSALLAVVLRQELGPGRMLAAVGRSPAVAADQWEAAHTLAERFDVPLVAVATHELEDPRYSANPTNRCFFCKTELWSRLGELARERGLAVVCDGTNVDDLGEHRPGAAAGMRAGVRSPLAEAGLTKADIRVAARELGLPNWSAPAAPCLASRVRYGLQITPRRLREVEAGEAVLRGMGVKGDLRVRHHGDAGWIEVEAEWIPWVQAREPEIAARLHDVGFAAVEIDPRGYRRGSLLRDARGR
ncbi:MAG TPA: ATP-dependent sacrificial sulfur transferase LarE [Gemmatimonadales bacterium]|nr:ATP-dependent sacrificial sulfur transferase LarE [Gemmatimonadales bacterium]